MGERDGRGNGGSWGGESEGARKRGGLRDMAQGQGGWQMTFTEGVGLRFMFSLSPESTLSILKQELFKNEKET